MVAPPNNEKINFLAPPLLPTSHGFENWKEPYGAIWSKVIASKSCKEAGTHARYLEPDRAIT